MHIISGIVVHRSPLLCSITTLRNLWHTKYIGFDTFAKRIYIKVPCRNFLNGMKNKSSKKNVLSFVTRCCFDSTSPSDQYTYVFSNKEIPFHVLLAQH